MSRLSGLRSSTALSTVLLSFVPATALAADLEIPVIPEAAHWVGDLPAVSGPNAKISAFGGSTMDEALAGFAGAVTLPVGQRFGVQLDGMVGTADEALLYGGAVHAFWRDPSKGLLGVYASYVDWDLSKTIAAPNVVGGLVNVSGAEVAKVGLEAEYYMDRLSFEGLAAWQFGTFDGFAGRATGAYYVHDDFRLDATYRYTEGLGSVAAGGFEWQPSGWYLSLFGDGGSVLEDTDNWHANGGLKVYFGAGQKSLIRRHREDDPTIDLPPDAFETQGDAYCADALQIIVGGACVDGDV